MSKTTLHASHVCLSPEEARRCAALDAQSVRLDGLLSAVQPTLDPGVRDAIDLAAWDVVCAQVDAIPARLCALRPDLAPVFVWACWPDGMTMPDHVQANGLPLPATDAAALMEEHRLAVGAPVPEDC